MPDKEKLIDLIGQKIESVWGVDDDDIMGIACESFEKLADHLLANGVTIQKHGRWLGEPGYFKCSCCGKYGGDCGYETSAYCPNCGAKMEG